MNQKGSAVIILKLQSSKGKITKIFNLSQRSLTPKPSS
jgi:hypothetical protein